MIMNLTITLSFDKCTVHVDSVQYFLGLILNITHVIFKCAKKTILFFEEPFTLLWSFITNDMFNTITELAAVHIANILYANIFVFIFILCYFVIAMFCIIKEINLRRKYNKEKSPLIFRQLFLAYTFFTIFIVFMLIIYTGLYDVILNMDLDDWLDFIISGGVNGENIDIRTRIMTYIFTYILLYGINRIERLRERGSCILFRQMKINRRSVWYNITSKRHFLLYLVCLVGTLKINAYFPGEGKIKLTKSHLRLRITSLLIQERLVLVFSNNFFLEAFLFFKPYTIKYHIDGTYTKIPLTRSSRPNLLECIAVEINPDLRTTRIIEARLQELADSVARREVARRDPLNDIQELLRALDNF